MSLFVRRFRRGPSLSILRLGNSSSVCTEMTLQANLRLKGFGAVWTGQWLPWDTWKCGLSCLSCAAQLLWFCLLSGSWRHCIHLIATAASPWLLASIRCDWCWRFLARLSVYLCSVSSGLLGRVSQSKVRQRGVSSEANGLACELHCLPSVAGSASWWYGCLGHFLWWARLCLGSCHLMPSSFLRQMVWKWFNFFVWPL